MAGMRMGVLVVVAWVWGVGIAPSAQEPPVPVLTDPSDVAAAMIRIDDDWVILGEAAQGPTYLLNSVRGDGITRLDRITAELRGVRAFLQTRSRTDASSFADRALRAVKGLRVELVRAEPDQAAALEEVEYVTRMCAACHERFRDGDPAAGYRFKAGVID